LSDVDTGGACRRSCVEGMINATHEELLRRLALHDEPFIDSALGLQIGDNEAAGLDPKTHALIRLGALVAQGAAPVSYSWAVEAALAAGATIDEIIGTLIAVAPIIGLARVVSATLGVALAIGYDLDQAFEALDEEAHG
jgi:4-carboxymuconolactone decarboxylase